jgi:hypothetical protein
MIDRRSSNAPNSFLLTHWGCGRTGDLPPGKVDSDNSFAMLSIHVYA